MSDRCKKCGRPNFRAKLGLDTCGCDEQTQVAEYPPKLPVPKESVKKLPEKPKLTAKLSDNLITHKKGICRKCGKPRAKGSDSYCRLHERERLKKWRALKKEPDILKSGQK